MKKSCVLNSILLTSVLFTSVPVGAVGQQEPAEVAVQDQNQSEKNHFGRTCFELASGLALSLVALTSKNKVEGTGFGALALGSFALAAQDSGLVAKIQKATQGHVEAVQQAADNAVIKGRQGTAWSIRNILISPLVYFKRKLAALAQLIEPTTEKLTAEEPAAEQAAVVTE